MQIEPHKLDFGFKPEFMNRSPASSFMGLQPRDLPRPATILSNAGKKPESQVGVFVDHRLLLDLEQYPYYPITGLVLAGTVL